MRFYHDGGEYHLPTVQDHPEHGTILPVPPDYQTRYGTFVQIVRGSLVVISPDIGIVVVPPGGFVDIEGLTEAQVKAVAPQLLTEKEWQARQPAPEPEPIAEEAPAPPQSDPTPEADGPQVKRPAKRGG